MEVSVRNLHILEEMVIYTVKLKEKQLTFHRTLEDMQYIKSHQEKENL